MKLELFNNAIHSIYHALEEIKYAESYVEEDKEFDHDSHIVSWKNDKGQESFYLDGYSKPPPIYGYKFVILNLIQGLELVLKSYLHERTDKSIFEGNNGYTINLREAIKSTLEINPIMLNKDEESLVQSSSFLRNQIQHYQFTYEIEAIRNMARSLFLLISKIVSFLFDIKLREYFEFDHWKNGEDQIVDVIRSINWSLYNNS